MDNTDSSDPSTWDPALDAVAAAPKHHKVLFENDNVRVIEVTLEPNDEEPIHHHRVLNASDKTVHGIRIEMKANG